MRRIRAYGHATGRRLCIKGRARAQAEPRGEYMRIQGHVACLRALWCGIGGVVSVVLACTPRYTASSRLYAGAILSYSVTH